MQRGELVQDRYELEGAIGQGGMAEVWRARDLRLGREVAVKFLAPRLADDPDFLVRFFTEAQNVARISSHPSVVDVLDFGRHEGSPYLVMEYVSGGALSELVGRPLLPERAFEIVGDVARGLHAAHRGGVVHRDIKPANILLDSSGRAKIADFGIAWTQGGEALTITGAALGTPHYMPPEHVSGGETTALSDVYSLGVVLYELLTGRRPFDGESATAVAIARIDREPPPPSFHNEDLGPDVDGVVMRSLALDPADRFSSADDLAEALDELRSRSIAAARGTRAVLAAVSSGDAGKPRFLAATIVILLLLFLAGAGVVSRTGGDDPAPDQPAPEREEGRPAPRPSPTVAEEPAIPILEPASAGGEEKKRDETDGPAIEDVAAPEEDAAPTAEPTPEPTPEPTVEPTETPNEDEVEADGGSSDSSTAPDEPEATPSP